MMTMQIMMRMKSMIGTNPKKKRNGTLTSKNLIYLNQEPRNQVAPVVVAEEEKKPAKVGMMTMISDWMMSSKTLTSSTNRDTMKKKRISSAYKFFPF